jgi:hypothetical protein
MEVLFCIAIFVFVAHIAFDYFWRPVFKMQTRHRVFAFRDKVRMAVIDGEIDAKESELLQEVVNLFLGDKFRLGLLSFVVFAFRKYKDPKVVECQEKFERQFSSRGKELYTEYLMILLDSMKVSLIPWAPYAFFAVIAVSPFRAFYVSLQSMTEEVKSEVASQLSDRIAVA